MNMSVSDKNNCSATRDIQFNSLNQNTLTYNVPSQQLLNELLNMVKYTNIFYRQINSALLS